MMNKRLRSYLFPVLIAFFLALLTAPSAVHAQQKRVLTFPSIPCDSTACDSLVLHNPTSGPTTLVSLVFRDSISYSIDSALVLPRTITGNDSLTIPICFTPKRRGIITDSLTVVVSSSTGPDTLRVRVTGSGIGPTLDAQPNVLIFPKTNPGASSRLTMMLRNTGELPFDLTNASLVIPAPFKLVTPLPQTIGAGDSLEIEVEFEPTENGVYSSPVDLYAGCSNRLQLGFNGVTDLIGTGAVLRISKTGFNPVNNEQIPCDSLRCTKVLLSNVGNAPLMIESIRWALDSLGYTITTSTATPFFIAPNSQRELEICLSSRKRGTLRDTLIVVSNSRSSIAFGMVIDVSGSMKGEMICGNVRSTRMEQAKIQAKNFIGRTLLHLPAIGIQDQLAILTYTSTGFPSTNVIIDEIFPLAFITDASRTVAQGTIDGLTPQSGTPTGEAVKRMVDIIASSPVQNKVIVLLTDGVADPTDRSRNPVETIAAYARERGIKVFTIGVGLNQQGIDYLQALSSGTSAASFNANDNDCSTLQTAFESITDILSRGAVMVEPFGMKVLSPYIVTVRSMDFDTVHVNGLVCDTLTLTNAGEGNAVIDSIQFLDLMGALTDEFRIPASFTFPVTVPESGLLQIPVCFNPAKIRMRDGEALFYYNSCGSEPARTTLSGAAYAWANLRVSDMRVGLPGDNVSMPIHYDTALTAYSVNTISCQIRWNKSMLDLRGVRPGAQAGGGTVAITTPVTFDEHYATVGITASGTGLPGAGELAVLDFQVLRGDSLGSLVEVTSGLFEDNNPKTRLSNAGIIAFDSTCFRPFKPLDAGIAAKVTAGEIIPTPAVGRILTLPLLSDAATTVSLEVYATDGRLIRPSVEQSIGEGTSAIAIDMSGAPAGSYYAVIRTSSGETILRKVLIY